MADHLSQVFDLVEVRGVVSGGFAARGPWGSGGDIGERMKFIAMVSGRAVLRTDGIDVPIVLETGDVAILNGRSWLRLEGGEGDGPRREVEPDFGFGINRQDAVELGTDDLVIGGRVDLNDGGRELLARALPPLAHVRASAAAAPTVRVLLAHLFEEGAADRMGSAFALRQYGQLLLLEVIRSYVDQAELPPGWLRVLTDERLRPALRLMHAEPGTSWGLEALARAAAMSRTSFAERFRALAGVPPLTYLHRWRILLAQRALRDGDVRVGALAFELGYGSESAFSTAFKRETGESPLQYRRRLRDEGGAGADQVLSGSVPLSTATTRS
ncbi:AraC family transcriptional regulator [Glycomyces albidus]|uniref:Helix-turn-helix domain-containing protein n=1 Tax=Glycomyces albidus TaxID=2656774 RepID=A0A6L5GD65_9ACTN|nr:AraC family transcriptional regulator [Glycomyces albidus]MQM27642.1 helix-turn-helix domain-containing protein [Glycomyces albidus]